MNYFNEYSRIHVHFLDFEVSDLLVKSLEGKRKFSLIDLGCGDGRLLYALHKRRLLTNAARVVGVDLSEERIKRLVRNVENVEGLVSDACNILQLESESFDVVICSQVIEHVSSDRLLIKEIRRLMRKDGVAYISTVIKKRYGIWIYKKGKGFRLDPTHIREYPSKDEFLKRLCENGLVPFVAYTRVVEYPFFDLLVRLVGMLRVISLAPDFYVKNRRISALRRFRLPVIGYETIEVLCKRANQ